MAIVNSSITDKIFMHSTIDFKEEYIQFILSEDVLNNQTINETKSENEIKELKEKMVTFPYCSISWRFVDPFEDLKNHRFIKILMQNFDKASMDLLAHSQ
jgi:hypothetical protein